MKFLFQFLKQILKRRNQTNALEQIRFFGRWKRSLKKGASSMTDEQPWITFYTIDYLREHLNKESKVFEFGGGGSTLFFLNNAGQVVTVEHNKEWFTHLSSLISGRQNPNWAGNYIEPSSGNLVPNPNIANPDHYASDDAESKNFNYLNYATKIDEFEDGYFDVVLVDGRSRPSCIKHSISKLKMGGLLVLDNSNRSYYLDFFTQQLANEFETIYDKFGACPYLLEFTKTSVFRKKTI